MEGIECILYGELYTTYKTETINEIKSKTNIDTNGLFFGKKNDVIIPASGETPIDIATACCVCKDNVLFGGDLNIIRLKTDNGSFISCQLNGKRKIDIAKIAQGASIVHLHNNDLKKLYLYTPTDLREQIKIVELFSLIDNRINTQNKIIKDLRFLKKILMEHILNSFDFEELSLKDIIQQNYARIIKPSELKPFAGTKQYLSTSSIGEDGIEQIEQTITYDNRPSRASMLPIKNSIWFAKMKNSIKVYQSTGEDEHNYVLSTGFYGILCNDMKVNPIWIFETFKSAYFNNQKDRFSEGSSMSGIKDNQLSDIRIKLFLNKDDEKSCSEILSFLSKKIEIEIKLSEKYKEQKKFLLSNMFI